MPRIRFAAIVAACTIFGSASANALDKLDVGLAAVYAPSSTVFAAKELGIFKDKNLDVDIVTMSSGPAALEALLAGALDIYTGNSPGTALAIARGVPVKVVAHAGDVTPTGWHLVVRSDSAVKELKDLDGKTVAISSKGSATDAMALWAARFAKINFQTVPLGTGGMMPALRAKQVDASIVWPILSFKAFVDDEFRSVADFGVLMPPMLPDVWVTSDAIIKDKPDVIRRFLEGNGKALVYMQTHEAWSLDFLRRYTGETDDRVIKMTYDLVIKPMRPDGRIETEWMTYALGLAKAAGVTGLPEADGVFSTAFTPVDYR